MSQYLQIDESTRMKDLGERVGFDYVDTVLAVNGLIRKPAIFEQLEQKVLEARQGENVGWQRKASILNKMVGDSDVFETAALMSEDDWKVYQKLETFPGFIKMPPSVVLPKASDIMGDGEHIGSVTYKAVMNDLQTDPHIIKEGNFSKYSTSRGVQMREGSQMSNSYGWNIFPIPWGKVSLYSSISGEMMDIPAYPKEVSDKRAANYSNMPDLLYQYEPWIMYSSSGPRECTYEFELHRDMWTGDHNDGKCNQLIRFLQSNCYPKYNGSSVIAPTVTLYVNGQVLINGVMKDVSPKWSGPLGHDGWYLYCELSITIQEVSNEILNYESVRNKALIG